MIIITRTFPLIMFFILSCGILTRNPDYKEPLFVPGDNDVPGWRILPDKTKRYGREDLSGALKDRYSAYTKYGYRELVAAEYVRVDDPGKKINIEICRLNNSLNAFGIFSFERAFMYDDLNICGYSYASAGSFFAVKGEYYIRINSNNAFAGDLFIFGEAVCARIITEERPLPAHIALFGNDGLKNVIYRSGGLPALPDINNFFLRKKIISGKTKIVFFARRETGIDSFREFSNLLALEKKPFVLLSTDKSQVAFRKNTGNDYLFISAYNEWLFGVFSAVSVAEGREIINILFEELIEFLNRNG